MRLRSRVLEEKRFVKGLSTTSKKDRHFQLLGSFSFLLICNLPQQNKRKQIPLSMLGQENGELDCTDKPQRYVFIAKFIIILCRKLKKYNDTI